MSSKNLQPKRFRPIYIWYLGAADTIISLSNSLDHSQTADMFSNTLFQYHFSLDWILWQSSYVLGWTQLKTLPISFQHYMLVLALSIVVVARGLQRNACSVLPVCRKWVHCNSSNSSSNWNLTSTRTAHCIIRSLLISGAKLLNHWKRVLWNGYETVQHSNTTEYSEFIARSC